MTICRLQANLTLARELFFAYVRPMKLADWLKGQKMSRKDFALATGLSRSYVTELCQHAAWPRREVVNKISHATGGMVSANDFLIEPAE